MDLNYRLWLVLVVPLRDSQDDYYHLEPESAVLLESGHRPLRYESFEHLIVMWHSPMPVNGFSFGTEKFFIVLSFNTHPVELAGWTLRRESQERRRLTGRSI